MKRYVKLQIIKHALQYYLKRPEATEKEVKQETKLLEEINERIDYLKDEYNIN